MKLVSKIKISARDLAWYGPGRARTRPRRPDLFCLGSVPNCFRSGFGKAVLVITWARPTCELSPLPTVAVSLWGEAGLVTAEGDPWFSFTENKTYTQKVRPGLSNYLLCWVEEIWRRIQICFPRNISQKHSKNLPKSRKGQGVRCHHDMVPRLN